MSKSNPILPSEPLSLQPNVAAEVAKGQDTQRQLSPRSASKVRRRMDIRNFGRSESPGRTGERDRYRDQEYAPQVYRPNDEMREPGDRAYYERRDGRSHSPRPEKSYGAEYGRSHETRETHDEEHKSDPAPTRVLGIFGMSKYTSEQNLREIFERYGPIEKVHVIRDPHDGRSRGFAFINMVDVSDAQRAREALTGSMVHDRRVRVDFSLTSKAHSPTPGKYKGQETGSAAFHDRGAYRSRADDGYRSHRSAPYRPRRRANTRDRRREDHPYKHGHQGDHYSRSKSPGFQNAQKPSDSFRRGPPSYANSDRDREYSGRRMNNGHGSLPQRSNTYEQGYDRGYSQRSGMGNERPRDDYRSNPHSRPSY
ncbi:hypothetical protein GGH12_002090 [Coemansia sp. RSA 1822]|nr:hypothetical protein LPJ76_002550 [Coemansia sp. RSA 638]KAJ2122733.1 hypothetical protein IW147_003143 [Coemansia sp. RSA 720]KAJ2543320.1 hypothetical protein GGF49_002206 [Coemansia sp. RSA 1853]KAJ2564210.1 hypothetical protein GGH12_002090 [Coemansia sp. RSA 1822]